MRINDQYLALHDEKTNQAQVDFINLIMSDISTIIEENFSKYTLFAQVGLDVSADKAKYAAFYYVMEAVSMMQARLIGLTMNDKNSGLDFVEKHYLRILKLLENSEVVPRNDFLELLKRPITVNR